MKFASFITLAALALASFLLSGQLAQADQFDRVESNAKSLERQAKSLEWALKSDRDRPHSRMLAEKAERIEELADEIDDLCDRRHLCHQEIGQMYSYANSIWNLLAEIRQKSIHIQPPTCSHPAPVPRYHNRHGNGYGHSSKYSHGYPVSGRASLGIQIGHGVTIQLTSGRSTHSVANHHSTHNRGHHSVVSAHHRPVGYGSSKNSIHDTARTNRLLGKLDSMEQTLQQLTAALPR